MMPDRNQISYEKMEEVGGLYPWVKINHKCYKIISAFKHSSVLNRSKCQNIKPPLPV
jgi:hypothetical protein